MFYSYVLKVLNIANRKHLIACSWFVSHVGNASWQRHDKSFSATVSSHIWSTPQFHNSLWLLWYFFFLFMNITPTNSCWQRSVLKEKLIISPVFSSSCHSERDHSSSYQVSTTPSSLHLTSPALSWPLSSLTIERSVLGGEGVKGQ